MATDNAPTLPHIVVLGAGFAGLTFCRKFPSGLARITVVDRQNHHLFQPLLYQVASAGLSAPDIAQPTRSILASKPNLRVVMDEIEGIDLGAKKVRLTSGELAWDYLLIGLGGVNNYFGHPEWEKHAPGLKSLDEALRLRRDVLLAYEHAETEDNEERRKELLTTIVIGGGPTGVEMAGSLAELGAILLKRDFDRLAPLKTKVVLVEGSDRLLGQFPEDLSASAKRQLESLGVEIHTSARVQDIQEGAVHLADGTVLHAGTIIWTAGVAASPLTRHLGTELDRAGRIKILPDCSLPNFPQVFAAGDIVSLTDKRGRVVPGVSPAAMQMATHIAKIVAAEIEQGPVAPEKRPAFAYWDKGSMATIGRFRAVAKIGRFKFSGYFAWLSWLVVHLLFLVGFRNKIAVFGQWIYSYVRYKRGARLITGLEQPPSVR